MSTPTPTGGRRSSGGSFTSSSPIRRSSADRTPSPTMNMRSPSSMPGSGFGAAPGSSGPTPPPPATTGRTRGVDAAQTQRKVAELHAMFPNTETSVIEIVLEGCQGSSDRAIEQLLTMADPDYRPEVDKTARTEAESQTDLDAELARSLQLQDEEDYRRYRETYIQRERSKGAAGGLSGEGRLYHGLEKSKPHSSGGGFNDTGEFEMVPYQPRLPRRQRPMPMGDVAGASPTPMGQGQGQGQARGIGSFDHSRYSTDSPGGDNPPGMIAVEEKLNQFAEAGKQTFNTFLSKAKAKYGEYQAAQAASDPNRPKDASNLWGVMPGPPASGSGNAYGAQYGDGQRGAAPGGGRGGAQNYTAQGQAQRPGPGQGQGGMWDDGRSDGRSFSSRSESFSSASEYDSNPTPSQPVLRQSNNRWNPNDTFDEGDPWAPKVAGVNAPASGRKSPGLVGSPEKNMSKIDPAKLGILPKKKVDLLSSSPGAAAANGERRGSGSGGVADPLTPAKPAPAELVSKLPPTPPATSPYRLQDSDDELEYTRNPFDEK